jgi:hypothetical protein
MIFQWWWWDKIRGRNTRMDKSIIYHDIDVLQDEAKCRFTLWFHKKILISSTSDVAIHCLVNPKLIQNTDRADSLYDWPTLITGSMHYLHYCCWKLGLIKSLWSLLSTWDCLYMSLQKRGPECQWCCTDWLCLAISSSSQARLKATLYSIKGY